VVADPLDSEVSLTLFVGLMLLFEGVMELAAAAASQGKARGLVLVDGLVTALLGGLRVAEWPSEASGPWAPCSASRCLSRPCGCWAAPTKQRLS